MTALSAAAIQMARATPRSSTTSPKKIHNKAMKFNIGNNEVDATKYKVSRGEQPHINSSWGDQQLRKQRLTIFVNPHKVSQM